MIWRETSRFFRVVAPVSLIALSLCGDLRPAEGATHEKRVLIGAGLSAFYDDNVIQYSGDQIALFESGLNPERFSIESVGDAMWRSSLSLGFENRARDGRGFDLSLRGRGEFHNKDKTADFRSLSAEWKQSFSRRSALSLRAYYLPHFYLRQLFDDDAPAVPTHYRRAEFALTLGSLGWRQRITRGTWAGFSYQYEHRGYNPEFTERTSNTQQAVAEVTWTRRPGRGSFGLHGGYRRADAKASDGDEAPGVAPDDADIGYQGLLAGVDGRLEIARRGKSRVGASLGYELGSRDYTSGVLSDAYHLGRNDIDHSIQAVIRWSRPHWAVQGFYGYDRDIAHLGAAAPPTSDVGSYTENRVGLSLEWSGVLWRVSGSGGTEAGADTP